MNYEYVVIKNANHMRFVAKTAAPNDKSRIKAAIGLWEEA